MPIIHRTIFDIYKHPITTKTINNKKLYTLTAPTDWRPINITGAAATTVEK